LTYSYY